MELSKSNQALIEAYNKGYKITDKGEVVGLKNKTLCAKIHQGYKRFCIRLKSGERYIVNYHKLQAYQKFGDKIFEEGIVVRHLNGDSLDNSWENISIGTNSDNCLDKHPVVRKEVAINAARVMQNNIRTYEDRCKIYEDLKNKVSYKDIMKKHNISSKGTLSFMKNKSLEYKEYLNNFESGLWK